MARFLLLAVLTAASGGCFAGEWWLLGPGASYHFERRGQNERHLAIGIEKRLSLNWGAALAFVDNSSNRLSIDAVAGYMPWRYERARWGLMGGFATGYRDDPLEPIVIGGFAATVEWSAFGLNAVLIPTKVLFLQVKLPLR